MAKRTVLRSSTGTKLYAVRDKDGKFKDIQTYARAHAMDLRKTGTANDGAAKKKAAAKKAGSSAPKKAVKSVKSAVKRLFK